MSTAVMAACWPLKMSPSQKAVLMSLADNANDHGDCWPAISTIAERTCLGRSTVIRAIEGLERAGHLKADRSNGRHTRYTVTPNLDLFQADPSRSDTRPALTPVSQRDPSRSGTTRPALTPDPSRSDTGPVPQRDTNRKEPKGTVNKSNRQERASALACPPDVPESTWRDWLALRKRKKADVTETVITGARREAQKANMSFADFLVEWCTRGSQGLKAEWLIPKSGTSYRDSEHSGGGASPAAMRRLA